MTNEIVEIQGVWCDDCDSAGFVMLHENGDTEILACNCEKIENEYQDKSHEKFQHDEKGVDQLSSEICL